MSTLIRQSIVSLYISFHKNIIIQNFEKSAFGHVKVLFRRQSFTILIELVLIPKGHPFITKTVHVPPAQLEI